MCPDMRTDKPPLGEPVGGGRIIRYVSLGYVYAPSELPKTLECARFISLRLFDLVNQGAKVIDLVVF